MQCRAWTCSSCISLTPEPLPHDQPHPTVRMPTPPPTPMTHHPAQPRLQDVLATEVDKVVMYDCFRPGDVVRAEVVSLGDARSYHLTTARNELGVVHATSIAGARFGASGGPGWGMVERLMREGGASADCCACVVSTLKGN